jgi:hypothetical protein
MTTNLRDNQPATFSQDPTGPWTPSVSPTVATPTRNVLLLSLPGDVAVGEDGPVVHMHTVLGLSDGTTRGGRLLEAQVFPTLEAVITGTPARLRKVMRPDIGIALTTWTGPTPDRGGKVPLRAGAPSLLHPGTPAWSRGARPPIRMHLGYNQLPVSSHPHPRPNRSSASAKTRRQRRQ